MSAGRGSLLPRVKQIELGRALGTAEVHNFVMNANLTLMYIRVKKKERLGYRY